MKITLALLLLTLPLLAQTTRTEFRQKYESPEPDTYSVRPGIIMSVKFAASPLWRNYPCEATIKAEKAAALNATSSEVMSPELVEQIIDEVIPLEQRGKLINQLIVNGGCNGLKISIYENVTISQATRCKQQGGGTYHGGDQVAVNLVRKVNNYIAAIIIHISLSFAGPRSERVIAVVPDDRGIHIRL